MATVRTGEAARSGRSEAEWDGIREPDVLRRRAAALLRDPGEEAAAIIRLGLESSYDAYSRRDWELNTLLLDRHGYEFRAGQMRDVLPDARELYRGVEGYLELHEIFLKAWPDLRIELADILRIEPNRVISLMRFSGRGGRSAIPLAWNAIGDNRFVDGLTVSQVYWWDVRAAAAALALPASAVTGR